MSERYYPQVHKYVFLVTSQVLNYVCLAKAQQTNSVPAEIQTLLDNGTFEQETSAYSEILEKAGFYDWEAAQQFFGHIIDMAVEPGEAYTSSEFEDMTENPIHVYLDTCGEDPCLIIEPDYYPSMFGFVPYASPKQLLLEYKSKFRENGIALPENFDWAAHVVNIDGVYYG